MSLQTTDSELSLTDWRQRQYNSKQSGYSSSASPPNKGPVGIGRTISTEASTLSEPVIANGAVYLLTGWEETKVQSIPLEENAPQWQREIPTTPNSNVDGPLACHNNTVLAHFDGKIFAFDAIGGDTRWKMVGGKFIVRNNTIYDSLTQDDNTEYRAIDVSTGNVMWKKTLDFNATTHVPAVDDEKIYFSGYDGIISLDKKDGSKQWSYGGSHLSSPSVGAGKVLVGGSEFFCLDKVNGVKVWSHDYGDGGAKITLTNEQVLVSAQNHSGAYDIESGEQLWTIDSPTDYTTPFGIANNTAYMGDAEHVYAVDITTGDVRWTLEVDINERWSDSNRTPVLTGNRILVTTTDNSMYFIKNKNKEPNPRIKYSPSNPEVGTTVKLSAEDSNDPDGSIVSYTWDINQNGISKKEGETTNISFDEPGEYVVKLSIEDDAGVSASSSRTILVKSAPTPTETPTPTPTETQTPTPTETPTPTPTETPTPTGTSISTTTETPTETLTAEPPNLSQVVLTIASTETLVALGTAVVAALMALLWNEEVEGDD